MWMEHRLYDTGLTEFDRVNALARLAGGVLIGTVLCAVWRRCRRA